jgi:hypothetical protein
MMSWAKTAGICCAMRRELFCMKNGSRGLFDTGRYVLATVVLSYGMRDNRCHASCRLRRQSEFFKHLRSSSSLYYYSFVDPSTFIVASVVTVGKYGYLGQT